MNLIEKIGGYEEAKNLINHPDAPEAEYLVLGFGYVSDLTCCGASDSSFVNATLHKNGNIEPITFNHYFTNVESVVNFISTVDLLKLSDELLEYRRQNNIFELNDWVLTTNPDFSKEPCQLVEDLGYDFKYQTKTGNWGYIVKSFLGKDMGAWRHASDKEIAQGFRDEIN